MRRLPIASALALHALLAAGLHAQAAPPPCPGGEADGEGIQISVSLAAHPTRVAATVDSLLVRDGYTVLRSPAGEGRWQIQPRFTYLEAVKEEAWVREPHPGVQLAVGAEARGDSTAVRIGARMLCKPDSRMEGAENVESVLELLTAARLATGLTSRMDTLRAAGVDVRAEVARPQFSLSIPEVVGAFRLVNEEAYEDPRLGTGLRYARPDDFYLDVYVYPGIPRDSACPAACAQARVDAETQRFTAELPQLIQRGYYTRMDVRSSDAVARLEGAAWLAARHLRMEVVRAQGGQGPQESDFILYAFPGYTVKVRATYAPSPASAEVVRAFTAEFLTRLVRS